MLTTALTFPFNHVRAFKFRVNCCDSSPSSSGRGFTPKFNKPIDTSKKGEKKASKPQDRASSGSSGNQAPNLSSSDEKFYYKSVDINFEQRLQAVKRSALEQKKAEEKKEFGPIDYDTPIKSDKKTVGLGTKIGIGVAVVVFGLVFALGDFLPSSTDIPQKLPPSSDSKLSKEEEASLKERLKEYEETLAVNPKDAVALEGAAVTLAELKEYNRAASLLQDLAKEKPTDPDVFRLLGEVKYFMADYEGSAAAYKLATLVWKKVDFDVLRGYTDALLAARKPDEAVKFLLATRESISSADSEVNDFDPIQVDLLLGKSYSDWGHVSDAIAVYDQLISTHPEDFRGYLAKGIVLKENGSVGDAERMFIQARFFAPPKAKAFVDNYAKR